MDSPLVRMILAVLGGYFLIWVFLSVYDWVLEEYPRRPTGAVKSERIQHPIHHQDAIKALQRFSRLPTPQKTAIKENLTSILVSLEQWRIHLRQANYQIVCLGESHEESTRRFLSEEFFAKFNVEVLLVEATPKELNGFIERMEAGRDYFPLLDADILNILRTVRDRNPEIKIYGIEETDAQAKTPPSRSNSRDQSITQNFWAKFEPGLCHIILFGALHCTNESNWLFRNLYNQASPTTRDAMLNVRILEEHQNGPVEAFVYFVDEIGVEKGTFVISDTRTLPDTIYEWFPVLSHQTLEKYRSLVVFRTRWELPEV